ncbi:helix-turn-helix domain-containing protein [Brochothrix thermosphacta]|uniref:XRE family transcriptional regulator n=1 Tax=Brochothrix thermosphacta TaxID=2756 RepID=A0A1D2KIG6_BROTH|nr:helix-turn-helix transcriptional regulator [Brochothrix thermosphacta]ATF25161.1 XRE family transcriptional regulator [Brochothrix thermosphacta]ATH84544.1 XRE family transcriptional regulator [Brochothrix thermosphacta]EUJ38566.1 helix-turn-helix family protein [Brochothrix thermosphacta DSM 20171 = FSL F6-1036]MPQ27593.1 XRE family transcriptional regulator [Brochothrix thermosphacta]ODJ48024.1 transcriptional regulator [Brochothrix thermosphacta DSM 20171 = FSL F6-1036]
MITIAELRAKNGKMSQRALAREIDTTQTSISNWEKDPLSMNAENIVKLCLYFNVTSDEILGIKRE